MTATPNIQHIVDRLNIAYPDQLRYEFYNRRRIGGSVRWSQHAGSEPNRDWWGNAVDIFDPTDSHNSALLDQVYAFLDANRERLRIRVLLWRVPNHHNHIHADTWPKMRDDGDYVPPPQGPLVTINDDDAVSNTFAEEPPEEPVTHTHQPMPDDLPRAWADDVWAQWVEASGTNDDSRTWDFYREDLAWVYDRIIKPLEDRVAALEAAQGAPGGLVLPADVRISEIP